MTRDQIAKLGAIYFIYLLSNLSLSVSAPFFPKEAHLKKVNSTVSGWIFSVFALTQFIVSPFYGRLLPRAGCRLLCIFGLLLCGTCTITFGMLDFLDTSESTTVFVALCFLVRILLALGCTLLSNTGLVMLVHYFPKDVDTLFGIGEIFTGIGMISGPALGGFLYSTGGYIMPFAVIGAVSVAAVPFYCCAIPPERITTKQTAGVPAKRFIFHPRSLVNSLVIILVACVWSVLDPTLEPHLREHGLKTEMVAVEFLVFAVFYSVSSPLWGRLAKRLSDKRCLIITGLILTAAGLLGLGPCPLLGLSAGYEYTWYSMVSLGLIGAATSMCLLPTYSSYIDVLSIIDYPENMQTYGMVSGLFVSVYALGSFIGPSLGGFLLDLIGFEWLVTWVALVCFLTCVLVCVSLVAEAKCYTNDKPRFRYNRISDAESAEDSV